MILADRVSSRQRLVARIGGGVTASLSVDVYRIAANNHRAVSVSQNVVTYSTKHCSFQSADSTGSNHDKRSLLLDREIANDFARFTNMRAQTS